MSGTSSEFKPTPGWLMEDLRWAGASLVENGMIDVTEASDESLLGAAYMVRRKLHVIEGEQARRAALPEGHRP